MKTEISKPFRVASVKPADLFGHKTYLLVSRQGEAWEVVRGDHNATWTPGMDVSIAAEINDSKITMDWDGDDATQLQRLSRRETEEVFDDN